MDVQIVPEVLQMIAKHCKQPKYLYLLTSSFGYKQHKTEKWGIYWKVPVLHFSEMKKELKNHSLQRRIWSSPGLQQKLGKESCAPQLPEHSHPPQPQQGAWETQIVCCRPYHSVSRENTTGTFPGPTYRPVSNHGAIKGLLTPSLKNSEIVVIKTSCAAENWKTPLLMCATVFHSQETSPELQVNYF